MMSLSTKDIPAQGEEMGTLFFLSGFPDRHNTFTDTLVPLLKGKYRCLVACLPDMDQPGLSKFLGYGREEIVEMIDRTIHAYAPTSPLTLVMHDWGSIFGLYWYMRNQDRVHRLVCLDVLTTDPLRSARVSSWKSIGWLLLYQWWFIAVFLVGRIVPLFGNILLYLLALLRLGPDLAPPPRGVLCPPRGPRWYMAYPYLHYWLEKIRGQSPTQSLEIIAAPVLYAYGQRKRVHFHSAQDLETIALIPGNKVIAYDCGHWVQHAKAEELAAEIFAFCSEESAGFSQNS